MSREMNLSRRDFVCMAGAACAGLPLATSTFAAPAEAVVRQRRSPDGEAVLKELLEGNERFASGRATTPRRSLADFRPLATGQNPEAVIVGCADSRVPPELLFDEGVGDLFVVRVAGNVVNGAGATVKGSIEYAVAELSVPLVMVLGHSNCGAVKAAIEDIDGNDPLPGALAGLIDLIRPAVARVKGEPGNLLENAIRSNVALGVERLKTLDPIVAPAVREGRLLVVGATYDLASGRIKIVA